MIIFDKIGKARQCNIVFRVAGWSSWERWALSIATVGYQHTDGLEEADQPFTEARRSRYRNFKYYLPIEPRTASMEAATEAGIFVAISRTCHISDVTRVGTVTARDLGGAPNIRQG
jgi:hypothetical protein